MTLFIRKLLLSMYNKLNTEVQIPNTIVKRTNQLLGCICFFTALQSVMLLIVCIGGLAVYDKHEDDIMAWATLPWKGMAGSVHKSYIQLQKTPIEHTLENAHTATVKLNSILQYHNDTTLSQFRIISDDLLENKGMIKTLHETIENLLPTIIHLQQILTGPAIPDLEGIVRRTNIVVNSKKTEKTINDTKAMLKKINMVLTRENIETVIHSIKTLSSTLEATMTASNINKTLNVIEDLDKSFHKAENTISTIGSILGK